MGNFYINIAVQGIPTETLRKKLAALPYPTILTTEIDGHSFVYGDFFGSGDRDAPGRLVRLLAAEAGANYAFFCMNADDDVFVYELWKNGERIDAHCSNPELFQPDENDACAPSGDPARLKTVFPFLDEQETRRVLDSENYVFEFQRHQDLFRLLRIPTSRAILDFQYLQDGESPEGLDESSLIRIGQ
ncbi:MAG: hypothetical protein ABI273_06430 [Lacunisphaera sp.]